MRTHRHLRSHRGRKVSGGVVATGPEMVPYGGGLVLEAYVVVRAPSASVVVKEPFAWEASAFVAVKVSSAWEAFASGVAKESSASVVVKESSASVVVLLFGNLREVVGQGAVGDRLVGEVELVGEVVLAEQAGGSPRIRQPSPC